MISWHSLRTAEWRLFPQRAKLCLLLLLELLLVRDLAFLKLSLPYRIFTQPDDHLEPSRDAAETESCNDGRPGGNRWSGVDCDEATGEQQPA